MCWAPPSRSIGRRPQGRRSRCVLLVPQALHDELEIRRLDPRSVLRALDRPEPAERRLDLAGTDLVEDALHEGGLDDHRLAGQLGVAFGRPQHRCSRRVAVQAIEAQCVPEQARERDRRSGRASRASPLAGRRGRSRAARWRARREAPLRRTPARCRRRGRGSTPRPGRGRGRRRARTVPPRARQRRTRSSRAPTTSATASASAAFGSSLQLEKTTTSGSSGSARSERATAACRRDDLPTPLGPYSTVKREAIRFATTISVSRSRPKNRSASSFESSKALSPLYGDSGRSLTRRPVAARAARRTTADPRRAPRRRSAARTPARAGSETTERDQDLYATGRSPQIRLRMSRRFQSAIS